MKKISYLITVVVLLLIINGLAHSIYDLWTKRDLLTEAQKTLDEEKAKNQKLKAELSYVQTKEFLEEEARNKLFLVKPDEKIVVIPTASPSASQKREDSRPNLQKWLSVFDF